MAGYEFSWRRSPIQYLHTPLVHVWEQHQQHMECLASRQLVQLAFVGDHDDEVVIDYIIYLLSPSTHSM